jgi:hypothetical protein
MALCFVLIKACRGHVLEGKQNKNYEENKLKETAMAPNYYNIIKKNLDFVTNDEL